MRQHCFEFFKARITFKYIYPFIFQLQSVSTTFPLTHTFCYATFTAFIFKNISRKAIDEILKDVLFGQFVYLQVACMHQISAKYIETFSKY